MQNKTRQGSLLKILEIDVFSSSIYFFLILLFTYKYAWGRTSVFLSPSLNRYSWSIWNSLMKFEIWSQNFIRNVLAHSNLKSEISVYENCLVLKLFPVIFAKLFLCSISQVIKTKHILLELKVPWPMSDISETYNVFL